MANTEQKNKALLKEIFVEMTRINNRADWDENKIGLRQKAHSLDDFFFDIFSMIFSEKNISFLTEEEKTKRIDDGLALFKKLKDKSR